MRAAPPVSVRCTGGNAWRGVQALLPALAVAVVSAWALDAMERHAWPALAAGLVAFVLAWRLHRPRPIGLSWDGRQWQADGCAGRLDVMIDLGPAMLLRLRGDRGTRWIAVTAAEAGVAMHALRVAAYAPPRDAPEDAPA